MRQGCPQTFTNFENLLWIAQSVLLKKEMDHRIDSAVCTKVLSEPMNFLPVLEEQYSLYPSYLHCCDYHHNHPRLAPVCIVAQPVNQFKVVGSIPAAVEDIFFASCDLPFPY